MSNDCTEHQRRNNPYPDDVTALKVAIAHMEERIQALHELASEKDKALILQAAEYARRMDIIQLIAEEGQRYQNVFVTLEKWEARTETDNVARESALKRIDEILEGFTKRYEEDRHNEALRAQAQETSLRDVQKAAEDLAQEAKDAEIKSEQMALRKAEQSERNTIELARKTELSAQETARKVDRRTTTRIAISGLLLMVAIPLISWYFNKGDIDNGAVEEIAVTQQQLTDSVCRNFDVIHDILVLRPPQTAADKKFQTDALQILGPRPSGCTTDPPGNP